jgi:hypothetical protein
MPPGPSPNSQYRLGPDDVFAKEAGHTDRSVLAYTLPEALLWLWRGYTIK